MSVLSNSITSLNQTPEKAFFRMSMLETQHICDISYNLNHRALYIIYFDKKSRCSSVKDPASSFLVQILTFDNENIVKQLVQHILF